MPCCRDRKKEESAKKREAMEAAVIELSRRQAEAGASALVIRKAPTAAPAEEGFATISPLSSGAKAAFAPEAAK